ncbi:MAG: tRNA (N(6)-L-threonylcarbamoyladenosine(37)-C(2))-methylthiotransferase MtaB [Chloroflexi bacterium]|nr:tRNA (N(6)-L-threonylcarbamoyladenosine(37)-C(2))-methylthiotransferase MtaB [Chloroflexota bacterium]
MILDSTAPQPVARAYNLIGETPRVALTTLGCKLNQAETEQMAQGFISAGFTVVDFGSQADVYVVNTCTVTHVADRKSRQLIRHARRLNPAAVVVVTGCYADVSAEEVEGIDGVDLVIPNDEKRKLVEVVGHRLGIQSSPLAGPGPGSSRTRAFVKIQDGCNQFCSYCIVPLARGRERSEPIQRVIDSVGRCHASGFNEVVLTGVHIGTYGRDIRGDQQIDLAFLVKSLLDNTSVPRIRLSSIEPQDFTDSMLEMWPSARLCRHLHLPLQSGCDAVLKRMRRPYTAEQFSEIVDRARRRIPGVALTTDIIVGFPGETEGEFRQTYEFAKEIGFAGIHVFKYSARKGTPAAGLAEQVPYDAKKARSDLLLELAQRSARHFASRFVGQTLEVLYESRTGIAMGEQSEWEGLSDNYLRVVAPHPGDLTNRLLPTRLIHQADAVLTGCVL